MKRLLLAGLICLGSMDALAGDDRREAVIGGALGGAAGAVIGQQVGGPTGAAIGGALGGATGAVIGQQVGGRNGAILGGAIGGATGAAIAVDKDGDEHYHTVGNQGPAIIVAPPGGRGSFCPPGQAKKGNC